MSPWLSDVFLSSQSDERLVRLTGQGHRQAFAVIVQRYRRELTRFAGRLCADGRAEDVVQQTFLSAFAALQNGSEVKHLRGWLYTILRHQAERASKRMALVSDLADVAVAGDSLEETVGRRMSAFEALSEINRLPERQRAALVATALEGRSRSEVAGVLGLSEGAVRSLVHRARSTVRAAVTAITPFPLLRWLLARQSQGADSSGLELVAGAGGASAGAVAVKVGAVVLAGLGVAGAIAVRPQATHRPPAVPPASASASGRGPAGSAPAVRQGAAASVRAGGTSSAAGARAPGVTPAAGPGAGSMFARSDGGGEGRSGGGDRSGSDGSFSDGGGPSGSSGGSDGGGGGSTSGSSDGGGSSVSSGGGSSDGGGASSSVASGSSDGGGGSTSGTSGSSDGGTLSGSSDGGGTLSGGSDGGTLSSGSTASHDSSGG